MSESSGSEQLNKQPSGNDGATHLHQEAHASGSGLTIQSGRDTHYHFRDGIRQHRQTDGPVVDECPYPGLAAFTAEQTQWFFGRDRLVSEIIGRLDGRRFGGGPLIVVAPSGAGKSSLFQAGLIPALMRGALPGVGSRDWPRLVFTPTSHPIRQAAACIASVAGTDPEVVAADLAAAPGDGAAILRAALTAREQGRGADVPRAIVIVDQLEELFTLCTNESERRGFIELLAAAAEAPAGGTPAGLVICGVRADFYTPCAQYPQLRDALQNGQILLGPMSEAELRDTIIYPAESVYLEIEPGLVELLLRDLGATDDSANDGPRVGYEAGRLPLLAHALRATWQQRHGSTLTVDGYQATGGIQHAVATTAELVFTGLGESARRAAGRLFLRLVKIGEGPIEDTRRRATRNDILAEMPEPGAAEAVLDAFTHARLLTQDQDTVEITHEALLRAWPRLRAWIDSDRTGNLISQQLEDDAANWDRQHRDPSVLYRGARLAAVRAWAGGTPRQHSASPSATAFLAASSRQEHRAARVRRAAIAVLVTLALVASGAAAFGFTERASAQASASAAIAQRNRALSAAAATEADALYDGSNSGLAGQLSLAAYKLSPTPEAYGSVLNATGKLLAGQPGTSNVLTDTVAFTSSGSGLSVGSVDALQFWQVNAAHPTSPTLLSNTPSTRPIKSVMQVWPDPGHPANVAILYGNRGFLYTYGKPSRSVTLGNANSPGARMLAFSHDGGMLAVGQSDGTVQLWNAANPAEPVTIGQPFSAPQGANTGITAAAFSADGTLLATVSGPFTGSSEPFTSRGVVRLWNIARPADPQLLPTTLTSTTLLLAFSPVGRTLATGDADHSVRLWDVSDPSHPRAYSASLSGHTGAILSMAFSPDGHSLATSSQDNSVRLWNVSVPADPTLVAIIGTESITDLFVSVAFGPHGLLAANSITLLNGAAQGRTWLWETSPKVAAAGICSGASASSAITRVQWGQYFPEIAYDPPCSLRR
jgi:WD40 repeat protein